MDDPGISEAPSLSQLFAAKASTSLFEDQTLDPVLSRPFGHSEIQLIDHFDQRKRPLGQVDAKESGFPIMCARGTQRQTLFVIPGPPTSNENNKTERRTLRTLLTTVWSFDVLWRRTC